MSDLIDRQAAIDALGEEPEVWSDEYEYDVGLYDQWRYDILSKRNSTATYIDQ